MPPAREALPDAGADPAVVPATNSVSADGSARLAALIAEQRRLVERMAELSRSLHVRDLPPTDPASMASLDPATAPAPRAPSQPPPLPITEPTFVAEPDPAATGLVRAIVVAGRFFAPHSPPPAGKSEITVVAPPAVVVTPAPDDATSVLAVPDEMRITIPETMAVARAELVPSPVPAYLAGFAMSLATGAALYWALAYV